MERLDARFHVLAVDSHGAGRSPEWPSDRIIALRDEVVPIGPVLARPGQPLALVAHSYGAAIALVVLCMVGGRSTASARGVTRLLCATLPQVEVRGFAECGQMGPTTHPELVNEAIARFLQRL